MRLAHRAAVITAVLACATPAFADVRVYEDKDEDHPKSLDLYGWIQPRFVKQQRDERDPSFPFTPNPAFTVQRFRLGGIAQLDWWATARFELELAGAGTPPLMDAYVIASPLPEFAFSVGQMRVPISRQNMLPSKSFQLPDTAYFVNAKFLHDRDMGAMVSGKVLDDRIRYFLGIFDGNEPGRGNTVNNDKYFMFTGRLEVSPLGAPPRFEGDLRPLEKRGEFLFNVSGSVMKNRLDDKHYNQTYYGADIGAWFMGASIYAEYFYKKSVATDDAPAPPPATTTAEGWNIQAGYFPPVPWVEEHIELAGRLQRFDPNKQVPHPQKDPGERDLDQSNPTWGYYGIVGGLNVFPTKVHEWKLQGSYEVRNETKACLAQQAPPNCTGAIKNNLLVIQATGAFLPVRKIMQTKRILFSLFGVATLLSAFVPVACQNTDNSGDTSGGGAGGTPSGQGAGGSPGQGAGGMSAGGGTASVGTACGFTIAAGKGFQSWQDPTMASDMTAAAPNIRRVRLGLGGNVAVGAMNRADPTTSFGVGWQTDDGTLATKLQWGTSPDPTTWDPKAVVQGYTWITPAGSVNAMEGPARMHEAYVCGLSPSTTYYYRVGGGPDQGDVWSPVYSYVTQPSSADSTVTFAVTGDSRGEQMNAWQILEERLHNRGDISLQLFSGDMTNLAPDEGEWNQWLDNAATDTQGKSSALSNLLTISAHGNHDNHGTLFFSNMVLPQDPTFDKYGELFFSFDVGPVHLVVIDDFFVAGGSNADYNSTLGTWLDADLAAAKAHRSAVPWIVTLHHHPVFSSSTHGMDVDVGRVGAFLAPYYDKYHVDLDVVGHDHDYERSKPLNGTRDAPIAQSDPSMGTVYLVCAGSGADPYPSNTSTFTDKSHDFQAGGAIGNYAILTVSKSSLKIDGHNLTADGTDGVFDTFTITK